MIAAVSNLFWAREQMGLSLGVHIILAAFGIAFPAFVLLAEWRYLRTGDEVYRVLARRWSKALGLLFAVGAVTGTIISFEFGLLWPGFVSRFGDVFGLAFAIEGIGFFLEAIFLAIYLYSWDRIPPRWHLLSGLPLPVTGGMAALFVVAVNAWMNTPTGFRLGADGKPTDVDPWAAIFNPSTWQKVVHMMLAGLIVVGSVLASVYTVRILRGGRDRYSRLAFTIAFAVVAVAAPAQLAIGDQLAREVADNQPTKSAALEGLAKTTKGAPLAIFGWYHDNELRGAISIPKMLSILVDGDPNSTVPGLDSVPPDDRAPVNIVHTAFDLMVGIGFTLFGLGLWFAFECWRRRGPPRSLWLLRAAALAGPMALVALECGWVATEVGRQPWIVYRVMRTSDAVTQADGIAAGFALLLVVYALLGAATFFALRKMARAPLPAAALVEVAR